MKVTCAHLWIQDDADLDCFVKLGVHANFTAWWHGGNVGGNPVEIWSAFLGEKRARSMFRCKTLWDTGANVTRSCDEVFYSDFWNWSPCLAMEVGMTGWINEKTRFNEVGRTVTTTMHFSNNVPSLHRMLFLTCFILLTALIRILFIRIITSCWLLTDHLSLLHGILWILIPILPRMVKLQTVITRFMLSLFMTCSLEDIPIA